MMNLDGHYFQVPNDIHRSIKSVYELCALMYLIRCSNGSGESFPSYQTISQGIMSRRQAIRAVKSLVHLGIVSILPTPFHANTFTLNMEKLLKLIRSGDQQTPVTDCRHVSGDTQSSDGDHQSSPLVTPSHPNKTHGEKNLTIKPKMRSPRCESFEKYVERMKKDVRFSDINHDTLLEKFLLYDETRKYKSRKAAWLSWLLLEIKHNENRNRSVKENDTRPVEGW
jgi:hypothetical protein